MYLFSRQAACELERGAHSSVCLSQSCHDVQYPEIRQDVAKFFNVLISHVQTIGSGESCSEEFLKEVIAEILDLLVFMRPLHELQEHVTSAGSSRGNKVRKSGIFWYKQYSGEYLYNIAAVSGLLLVSCL